MGSFWGEPTCKPRSKDVAKFVGIIRDLTSKQTPKRALQTSVSALKAIAMFVAHKASPQEALAMLDHVRQEVMGLE